MGSVRRSFIRAAQRLERDSRAAKRLNAPAASTTAEDLRIVASYPDIRATLRVVSRLIRLSVHPETAAAMAALAVELRVQHRYWIGFVAALRRARERSKTCRESAPRDFEAVTSLLDLAECYYLVGTGKLTKARTLLRLISRRYDGYVRHECLTQEGLLAIRAGRVKRARQLYNESALVSDDNLMFLRGRSQALESVLRETGALS